MFNLQLGIIPCEITWTCLCMRSSPVRSVNRWLFTHHPAAHTEHFLSSAASHKIIMSCLCTYTGTPAPSDAPNLHDANRYVNKKLCYCRGIARHALSVKILSINCTCTTYVQFFKMAAVRHLGFLKILKCH